MRYEQNAIGFDESAGLRRQLQVAGNAVERIINDNMSWLSESDKELIMGRALCNWLNWQLP